MLTTSSHTKLKLLINKVSNKKKYEQHLKHSKVSKEDESLIKQKAIFGKEIELNKNQVERTFKMLVEEFVANFEKAVKESDLCFKS